MLIVPILRSAPVPYSDESDKPTQALRAARSARFRELEAHYARQAAELDRKKLADLSALAQRQTGLDAEATYHAAFDLAVGHGPL